MREKLLQLCTEQSQFGHPKMMLGSCTSTPQTVFTVYKRLAERNHRPFIWPAIPRKLASEGLIAPALQADIDNGAEPGAVTDPDRFDNMISLNEKLQWVGRTFNAIYARYELI